VAADQGGEGAAGAALRIAAEGADPVRQPGARRFHRGSDVDLAIVLEPPIGRLFAVKCEVIDATCDLFLDSGILIQPCPRPEPIWMPVA
jgi:hypothetical protein